MNYYPFHIGDYLARTGHLEPMEDLAYRRMIDLYYLREQPLPLDAQEIARLIRLRSEADAVQTVLAEFFERTENGWNHGRCDKEIAHASEKREKARASAALSVQARSGKRLTTVERPLSEGLAPNPNPNPITQVKTESDAQSASLPVSADVATVFEFWKTAMKSPKSLLDDKRRKAIKSALKTGYTPEQLCDAIAGCAKSAFHMGDNDRRAKYNGLDLILRSAEKIDQFIVIGRSPLVPKKQGYVHDLTTMDYTKGVDEHGNF